MSREEADRMFEEMFPTWPAFPPPARPATAILSEEQRARDEEILRPRRRGGARLNRGRHGVQTVRLTLRVDKALVAKVQEAQSANGGTACCSCGDLRSFSAFLRHGITLALDKLDAGGALPETLAGDWQIVALKISPELDARIAEAVAAGRAPSVVALVRGAAALLVNGPDAHGDAGQAGQP